MERGSGRSAVRLAFVLWTGNIGGAEHHTVELARTLKKRGCPVAIVFVSDARPLVKGLHEAGVPHASLGLPRGRSVLRHPRRLARVVSALGPDAAVLISSGYLAAALRLGGYRAPIVAVEHGTILQVDRLPKHQRFIRALDRRSGIWACDAEVAVSRFLLERLECEPRPRRVAWIPNGVDLERFRPPNDAGGHAADGAPIFACASRLIAEKGVADLLRAFANAALDTACLRIAGDGPESERLRLLAGELGVASRTQFLGPILDMPSFWQASSVAVVPSNEWVESFGMVAVEAMACARPVVATDSGALREVVIDGQTGRVVPTGDIERLAAALREYADDASRRKVHGWNGRRACEERYDIEQTATRYLELCRDIIDAGRATRSRRGYEAAYLFEKHPDTTAWKLDPTQKASCRTATGFDDGPR